MLFVSSLIITAIIAFFVIHIINFILFWVKQHRCLRKLPAPPSSNFIIGNVGPLYDTPENIFLTARKWAQNCYPIYQINANYFICANVVNPEDCELMMNNINHINKSYVYNILQDWLGLGLLTSNGDKWKARRKILTNSFHFNILQQFVSVFNEETDNLVIKLQEQCHKPFILINNEIIQFTLKSITETAMGTKLKFNTKKEREYKESIFQIGETIIYRIVRPWLMFKPFYMLTPNYYGERSLLKTLHAFTKDVVSEREKHFNNSTSIDENTNVEKKRLAMLDLLLAAKNEGHIDHEGILEEVDTFMFEGHDTTASALSFVFMVLACHREAQDQILEEMQEVLGDIHKKPTLNELQEMKYLERCIKEVLRLYPSVPFVSRTLGEDMVTHSGYFLPEGTTINIHIYDIHHNPNIYLDPEKFDPDRFLPKNVQQRHLFAYVPFSAGPRNCIGQRYAFLELKSVVCGVLRNFVLEPIDTPETITFIADLILRTKDNIKVKFVPRKL